MPLPFPGSGAGTPGETCPPRAGRAGRCAAGSPVPACCGRAEQAAAAVLSGFKIDEFPSSLCAGCKPDEVPQDARTGGQMPGGSRWQHAPHRCPRCCGSGWEYTCPCIDFLSKMFHPEFTVLDKIYMWRSLACLLQRKYKSPLCRALTHSQGKDQPCASEMKDYL